MEDEDRLKSIMNRNVKLSPSMMALTWDVMFVWTIEVMFLTQVKGVSYSNVVLLDTFLMLFGVVGCLFVGKFMKNTRPTTALRLGLIGYAVYLLLLMLGRQYYIFVLAQIGLGLGYAFCGVKINTLINDSLVLVKRTKEFNKVTGAGMSLVYIIEGIGAILITYMYNVNPYACFILSLAVVASAFIITFIMTDTRDYMERNAQLEAEVTTELKRKGTMRFARARGVTFFLICAILFSFFMRGAMASVSTAYKIYLQQAQDRGVTKPWMFGYLFALSRIAAALFSKRQFKYTLKYGIQTIAGFIILTVVCFFGLSGLILFRPDAYWCVVIISITFSVLYGIRPALLVLVNKYTNTYVKHSEIDSATSKRILAEYLGSALGSLVFSRLLAYYNDALGNTFLTFSIIYMIPLIIVTGMLLRSLFNMFRNRQTIIKKEYTED